MKTKYEFRKKALKLACEEGFYNSVKCLGIYEGFEVYTPFHTSWKEHPPIIGLPRLIFANKESVKWYTPAEPYDVFEVIRKCEHLHYKKRNQK